MASIFQRPIPGQSLTAEPGRSPWERPPEYPNPLDALEYHLKQLARPDVVDDLMDTLTLGIPVSVVAGSMAQKGLMEGLYTVDTTMLLKPVLMLHIKGLAEVADIDFKMSFDDYVDLEAAERAEFARKLAIRMDLDLKGKKKDAGTELMQQTQEYLEEGMPEGDEMPEGDMTESESPEMEAPEMEAQEEQDMPMEEPEAPRNGLMARG